MEKKEIRQIGILFVVVIIFCSSFFGILGYNLKETQTMIIPNTGYWVSTNNRFYRAINVSESNDTIIFTLEVRNYSDMKGQYIIDFQDGLWVPISFGKLKDFPFFIESVGNINRTMTITINGSYLE